MRDKANKIDTEVAISCKEGYVLVAGSPISATCIDSGSGGEFDNLGASCIAVCAGAVMSSRFPSLFYLQK